KFLASSFQRRRVLSLKTAPFLKERGPKNFDIWAAAGSKAAGQMIKVSCFFSFKIKKGLSFSWNRAKSNGKAIFPGRFLCYNRCKQKIAAAEGPRKGFPYAENDICQAGRPVV
ncbi:MAG: hypothetical protein Q4B50_07650, partial [Bacillota bacterium]|nr:hypothetical protein [Bacillota bacterium]